MTQTTATKPAHHIDVDCENLFQSGGGRAQVRQSDGRLAYSCESKRQAINYAYEDQMVVYRAKVRGERRYEWQIVKAAFESETA